uniref:Uncharacterized protein n=1 Tax=Glossina brevipalpis TaxID=37001 RepID=A0A1A9X180_9MUSC
MMMLMMLAAEAAMSAKFAGSDVGVDAIATIAISAAVANVLLPYIMPANFYNIVAIVIIVMAKVVIVIFVVIFISAKVEVKIGNSKNTRAFNARDLSMTVISKEFNIQSVPNIDRKFCTNTLQGRLKDESLFDLIYSVNGLGSLRLDYIIVVNSVRKIFMLQEINYCEAGKIDDEEVFYVAKHFV